MRATSATGSPAPATSRSRPISTGASRGWSGSVTTTPDAPRGGRAMVGLSMAGHIAVLAATRIPLDVAVTFYGGWTLDGGIPLAEPDPPLAHSAAIAANGTFVMGFVGDQDFLVTPDEWQAIDERLTSTGVQHELISYPGAAHGFANEERPETYDKAATDDAWQRVLQVLSERASRQPT